MVDFINGKVVVSAEPSAAENAAAANIAARLGFQTTGLTPPVVVTAAEASGSGARIWIGKGAVACEPGRGKWRFTRNACSRTKAEYFRSREFGRLRARRCWVARGRGCVRCRCPFIWKVPGDQLSAIAGELNHAASNLKVQLAGTDVPEGKSRCESRFPRTAAPDNCGRFTHRAEFSAPRCGA